MHAYFLCAYIYIYYIYIYYINNIYIYIYIGNIIYISVCTHACVAAMSMAEAEGPRLLDNELMQTRRRQSNLPEDV